MDKKKKYNVSVKLSAVLSSCSDIGISLPAKLYKNMNYI